MENVKPSTFKDVGSAVFGPEDLLAPANLPEGALIAYDDTWTPCPTG